MEKDQTNTTGTETFLVFSRNERRGDEENQKDNLLKLRLAYI